MLESKKEAIWFLTKKKENKKEKLTQSLYSTVKMTRRLKSQKTSVLNEEERKQERKANAIFILDGENDKKVKIPENFAAKTTKRL